MAGRMISVTILVPALNEEQAMPSTIAGLLRLDPQPDEIIFVDGGSSDATCAIAQTAGLVVLVAPKRGRGAQINFGVSAANSEIVCVLHADSILPHDAITEIRRAMENPKLALGSFTPRIAGPTGTRWGSSFHNWIKTWYAPLLLRPILFAKGVRLLFGDHAMFFRRAQFIEIGGCDDGIVVMEEADLCIKLAR